VSADPARASAAGSLIGKPTWLESWSLVSQYTSERRSSPTYRLQLAFHHTAIACNRALLSEDRGGEKLHPLCSLLPRVAWGGHTSFPVNQVWSHFARTTASMERVRRVAFSRQTYKFYSMGCTTPLSLVCGSTRHTPPSGCWFTGRTGIRSLSPHIWLAPRKSAAGLLCRGLRLITARQSPPNLCSLLRQLSSS